MNTNNEPKSVELLTLVGNNTHDLLVPENTTATYDASKGPLRIKGKLSNKGTITVSGSKHAKVVVIAREFANEGKIECQTAELQVACASFENTGTINAGEDFTVTATHGQLTLKGAKGTITVAKQITLDGPSGLNVLGGVYVAPVIQLLAKDGNVNIQAERLDGEVKTTAKTAQVGTKEGNLTLGEQRLLSGNHVYWNYGGPVSVGNINVGSDVLAILSSHAITTGSITAGDVTLAAGAAFKINGSFPTWQNVQFDNQNVSFEVTSPYGVSDITIDGDFYAANLSLRCWNLYVNCDDFELTGDLTTYRGSMRIDSANHIKIDGDLISPSFSKIALLSDGPVCVGNVEMNNYGATLYVAGSLVIKAYREGGSDEFIIGGTNNTNGINGHVVLDTDVGGLDQHTGYIAFYCYVNNGGDGGITLTSVSDISVIATASKSGGIILHANDGTLTLPSGTLSANGTGSYPGGLVYLLADTIATADGTIVSASDIGLDYMKQVVLAANTITLTGSSGLTIQANGGGYNDEYYQSTVRIVPKGAFEIIDTTETDPPSWFYTYGTFPNGWYSSEGAVAFDGAGSAPLKISCNGDHTWIGLSGYPLRNVSMILRQFFVVRGEIQQKFFRPPAGRHH